MKFCLKVVLLLFVVSGTLTDEGFDLFDALDPDPTSAPKEPPKAPEQPKAPEKPKTDGGFGFDLGDAVEPDAPPTKKPKKPSSGDFDGFDLGDALKPGNDPKPDKPAVNPPKHGGGGGGGGGVFDDSDLASVGDGGYEPDGGRRPNSGNSGYDNRGGADHSQDPDRLWGPILKMLNANMPEEIYMLMSNLKQILIPLLERAMDLLHALP